MSCSIKYRPIIWRTSDESQRQLKSAFITGQELCPPCLIDGRKSIIHERHGGTT